MVTLTLYNARQKVAEWPLSRVAGLDRLGEALGHWAATAVAPRAILSEGNLVRILQLVPLARDEGGRNGPIC